MINPSIPEGQTAVEAASAELLSRGDDTIAGRRGRRINLPLTAGLLLFGLVAAACIAAPLITHYDPIGQDLLNAAAPPFSSGHILGTDAPYGRDILTRLLYGGRADLAIGIGGTGVTIIVGTILGLVAGYFGGWIDSLLMRVADVFFAFPFLVLVLAIVAMLGPSLLNLFIAIWAVGWVSYARIIRGETLAVKGRDYISAEHAIGAGNLRIMARHILPNIFAAALIFAMADAVGNILLAAALGYLGLGIPEPAPEWGAMISDGQNYMVTAWWVPALPGFAIVIVGIALSLVGDGLADLLRPKE
ncbi:MAG: ABC transporter permease [Chloroflexota bacterium]|nr:ABC transporter permease [Chloroflexota bacterium]